MHICVLGGLTVIVCTACTMCIKPEYLVPQAVLLVLNTFSSDLTRYDDMACGAMS